MTEEVKLAPMPTALQAGAVEPMPTFPPMTGSLVELCSALAPSIPLAFKIGAALTRVGLALSDRTTLYREQHLQPRFYTILLGVPGSGKGAAMNETSVIDRGIDQYTVRNDYMETGSIDSGPALVDWFVEINEKNGSMSRTPARGLLSSDEMSSLFEKAKMNDKSRNSLFGEMLSLFEANRTANRSRQQNVGDIYNAHLAILGGVQPKVYEAMWSGSRSASGGLQSRFTIIGADANPNSKSIQEPSDEAGVREAMYRLFGQLKNPPKLIHFDEAAEAMFNAWWQQCDQTSRTATRVHDIVKRFLIVLAVTNDTDTIDGELMLQGMRFGDYQIKMRMRFNPEDSTNNIQSFELAVVRNIARLGPLSRKKLCDAVGAYTNHGGLGPFDQAIKNLVREKVIVVCGATRKGADIYGIPVPTEHD